MKKSTTIILITSACLIFGGILIAGISGAVGGTRQFKALVDRQALNFDMPWGDTKLKLTTDGLYFTNENWEQEESEYERAFDMPEEMLVGQEVANEETGRVEIIADEEMSEMAQSLIADQIQCIEFELGAGEIEIKKSENGIFHVEEGGNVYIVSDYDNGTLKIKSNMRGEVQILGFHVGTAESMGSATIYIPDKKYEEISLDMGAGEFSGELPECQKLSVRLGAGECDFDYIKADEAELEVGAGECTIDLLEVNELDADIAMGQFCAKAFVGKELDAKVGMGEIAMEVIGEEEDFDYDVEVGAGEVRIGSRNYSGIGSGGSRKNGLERSIEVECGMGEATLTFVKE